MKELFLSDKFLISAKSTRSPLWGDAEHSEAEGVEAEYVQYLAKGYMIGSQLFSALNA